MALQMQAAPLEAQTVQAGQQAAAAQTQLDTDQVELAAANSQLAKTTGLTQAAQATLQSDRSRLAALIVARYMVTTNGTALTIAASEQDTLGRTRHDGELRAGDRQHEHPGARCARQRGPTYGTAVAAAA